MIAATLTPAAARGLSDRVGAALAGVVASLVVFMPVGDAVAAQLSCSGSRCKIVKKDAYLRYTPGGRGFSYLFRDDQIDIHGKSANGHYLCVTARTWKFRP